jgi:glycosyltransferase involved in cell wall biosynthesis
LSLTILSVAFPFAPVGPDAVGGAEQIVSALDRGLTRAGHRSVVVACQGSEVAGQLWPIEPHSGPIDDAARSRTWNRCARAIAEAQSRLRPDLVHLHGIDFDRYCPQQGRTLVTLHLPLDWYSEAALGATRPELWLHGVSESQQRRKPPGARFLAPISNGVDANAYSPRVAKRSYALFLGRICPEKGVHLAIEAARRAATALIIGGQVFPYEAHERYFAEEIAPELGPGCRFAGPLDFARKRRLLAAARCVVVPSLAEETSSLVAMEALASGTPVVAFGRGALPEIVDHGRTGFIVEDLDGMALAIRDSVRLKPEDCRREAERRFSLDAMVESYLSLYRELTSRAAA